MNVCSVAGNYTVVLDMVDDCLVAGNWKNNLQCRRTDGSCIEAAVRATAVELFDRKMVVSVWEDTTALRDVERSLLDSEQRFRAVFESTTDLIFVADR